VDIPNPEPIDPLTGALIKIFKAWTDPGRVPDYHRGMQRKLRKEWPVLAQALDNLEEITKEKK